MEVENKENDSDEAVSDKDEAIIESDDEPAYNGGRVHQKHQEKEAKEEKGNGDDESSSEKGEEPIEDDAELKTEMHLVKQQ